MGSKLEVKPGAPARRRNPRGSGGRLRKELVDATMRILDRAPGTELSLRMVAKEAGVTAPAIYPHFADARAMMSAIVRDCWRQLAEVMAEAEVTEATGDPLANLFAKMRAFVAFSMERPSHYTLIFAAQPIDPDEDKGSQGHLQPVYRQILGTVEAHVANGGHLLSANAASATIHIISLVHGRIALAHLGPSTPGNSVERVQAYLLEEIAILFPS